MNEFGFKNVFNILYKPLNDSIDIKKEELYRNIFKEVYRLGGQICDDSYDTAPFRKITTGIVPIQKYIAKQLYTEKGFELTRQCVEKEYLDFFENYQGIIKKLMLLFKNDTFTKEDIKQKILASCPEPYDRFHASRFITAVLICANYKERCKGQKQGNVFLNIGFMNLEEKAGQQSYPVYLTQLPVDITQHFVGREQELLAIEQIVVSEKSSLLISGIGGLGKTELVKSLLKKISDTNVDKCGVQYLAWVPYVNQDLKQSCKLAFNMKDDTEQAWLNVQKIAAQYRDKLLIVIDNVENRDGDSALLRLNTLPCRVLVTSRFKSISSLKTYDLQPMNKESCRRLFYCFYTNGRNDEYVDQIIELAACHTIMIEFLAKVARLEGMSIRELLKSLIDKGFKLSNEDVSSVHEKMQNDDTIIKQMCILFSLININESDKEILTFTSVIPNLTFEFSNARKWFGVDRNSKLMRLHNMGMLERRKRGRKDVYWMHSVIASAVREQQKDILYDKTRPFIKKLSLELDYGTQWGKGYTKAYLIPFSWSVADIMDNKWESENDVDFLTRLFYVCFECGNYKLCETLIKRVLDIDEGIEDINYRYLVRDYKNQSDILMKMENPNQALEFLDMAESLLQDDAWDIAERSFIWHKKGTAYNIKGDYKKAKEYYIKTLNNDMTIDGVSARELSTDYSSIGCLYLDMGQYKDAYDYIKRAINLDSETEEDSESIMNYCYLASVCSELYSEGHIEYYDEAVSSFEKVIAFREKNNGKHHTDLADVYHEYSLFLYYNGELDDAMRYSKMAYDINVFVHSEYSISAMQNKNTQGIILESMGKNEQAVEIYDELLDMCEIVEDVPVNDLALFHFNKAEALKGLVSYDEAIKLYNKCEELWKMLFEETSPNSTLVYHSIGECYIGKEEYEQSIQAFQKSIELNPDNLWNKIECIKYQGDCYLALEDMNTAREKYVDALSMIDNYNIDAYETEIFIYANLAIVYFNMDDEKKCMELLLTAKKKANYLHNDVIMDYVNHMINQCTK